MSPSCIVSSLLSWKNLENLGKSWKFLNTLEEILGIDFLLVLTRLLFGRHSHFNFFFMGCRRNLKLKITTWTWEDDGG
jgi:hypothetical protein